MLTLESPLSELRGVGPAEAAKLARMGLGTVRDLLLHVPQSFELYEVADEQMELVPGRQVQVEGTLTDKKARQIPGRKLHLTEAWLEDDHGHRFHLVWFNQQYLARTLGVGDRYVIAGLIKPGRGRDLEMQNPRWEAAERGPRRLHGAMPRYRVAEGVSVRRLMGWVDAVLPLAADLEETLPQEVRERRQLPSIQEAVRMAHQPQDDEEWALARRRFQYEELFELQTVLAMVERIVSKDQAWVVPADKQSMAAFYSAIGFELTKAQKRSVKEILSDMGKERPMLRLLNGDVGAGKTAVAAAAVAAVYAAGGQAVVMAPTEILARQHEEKFKQYLQRAFPEMRIELLVGSVPAAKRKLVKEAAAQGKVDLLVGTHALIEDDVRLPKCMLAVVDEQHRFGVDQRERLRSKGERRPHFLAMTATPIPRTLAMAAYGGMQMSVLDELPPGRKPVETRVYMELERYHAYRLVSDEIARGRQAFIICPLIEESEEASIKAATAELERLRKEVFPQLRLEMVHGKMRDKDRVMERFREGEAHILVATSVIEVGVDVPNASVMLIEGADRFGLAQLHQLRGRVGRGAEQSYCLLFADDPTEKGMERMELMTKLNDGFKLAEADLRMRGVGTYLGDRQHGISDLAMEALLNPKMMEEARADVRAYLAQDPMLEQARPLRRRVARALKERKAAA